MMENINTLQYWEEMYQTGRYLNYWDYMSTSQELVSFIATGIIPLKSNCLDVGCGSGNEAIFLSQIGYSVTGLDFSVNALKIAKEKAKCKNVTVDWLKRIVTDTGLPSNSFHFINDRACFHHIVESERKQYAKEMHRILKSNGYLLIRGSRDGKKRGFNEINEDIIDDCFDKSCFTRGKVLPITMIFDTGKLDSNIVVLKKK